MLQFRSLNTWALRDRFAGSNEKVAWALENGADEGINHAWEYVLGRMREITGGEGVEVVLDTVGGRVLS
jgi:NADPH2:quinone reductase